MRHLVLLPALALLLAGCPAPQPKPEPVQGKPLPGQEQARQFRFVVKAWKRSGTDTGMQHEPCKRCLVTHDMNFRVVASGERKPGAYKSQYTDPNGEALFTFDMKRGHEAEHKVTVLYVDCVDGRRDLQEMQTQAFEQEDAVMTLESGCTDRPAPTPYVPPTPGYKIP
jgi:hypothetical protein